MTAFVRDLALLALLGAVLGCASTAPSGGTAPSARTITPSDVKSLNGKWSGFLTGTAAGAREPLEMTISDGTYTSRIGTQSSNGTVTLTEGKIALVRQGGAGAGASTVTSMSTAVLQEREGRRVLVGQGRNDFGPFTFEIMEQR